MTTTTNFHNWVQAKQPGYQGPGEQRHTQGMESPQQERDFPNLVHDMVSLQNLQSRRNDDDFTNGDRKEMERLEKTVVSYPSDSLRATMNLLDQVQTGRFPFKDESFGLQDAKLGPRPGTVEIYFGSPKEPNLKTVFVDTTPGVPGELTACFISSGGLEHFDLS